MLRTVLVCGCVGVRVGGCANEGVHGDEGGVHPHACMPIASESGFDKN